MSSVVDQGRDQRAEAWEEVWKKVLAGNPDFHGHGRSGLESVLSEIDRLYDIELKYAVFCLRNPVEPRSLSREGHSEDK